MAQDRSEESPVTPPDEDSFSSERTAPVAFNAGRKTVFAAGREMVVQRRNTKPRENVFETVAWERRSAKIEGEGTTVFVQDGVEVPSGWSQTATNIVANKYFRGAVGSPERESSVRQLVGRVVSEVGRWAVEQKVMSPQTAETFRDELAWLLLHQHAAFNSPVWFNVGVDEKPQCSACFINSVEDSMESILALARTEAMLFKGGSGAGSNLSPIRGSREALRGGGQASGPVSFMRGFDAFAGVIKSGGKTRRAAKMVLLDVDHPDILEFIDSKKLEEQKAWALIEQGYSGAFNVAGGAYDSVFFQNANHSVRVTDAFMQAVVDDGPFELRARTSGLPVETVRAASVFRKIAEAAWVCGDPGVQFDSTINRWHTCKASGRINASNPCSEYLFLDDTACNLASINLIKYRRSDGSFDVDGFCHAVGILLLAQEILVDASSYPTPRIEANSHRFRPLGLGYANLGALLMASGLPYDSNEGRAAAAAITSLLGAAASVTSAEIAKAVGPFAAFEENRASALDVLGRHSEAAVRVASSDEGSTVASGVAARAADLWLEAVSSASVSGLRNAQVTVLAPTGTIGFMMDVDTTGIEPDIALVKYKKLVGGGVLKIANQSVALALEALGYDRATSAVIISHLAEAETIEGAPGLRSEDLAVFDCAFRPVQGSRAILPTGHVQMMAAVQPFLSGAISKTVNMPSSATPAEIEDIYKLAWRSGLKAIAVYRDGCKRSQPVGTSSGNSTTTTTASSAKWTIEDLAAELAANPERALALRQLTGGVRERLPSERAAVTHKFSIGGHEGYVTVGLYEDGRPGELFVTMAKEGSTISGLMDAFATAISIALQYGVPLRVLVEKFAHMRFEPAGFTGNPAMPMAKSICDYLFRWLEARFATPAPTSATPTTPTTAATGATSTSTYRAQADAPPCATCGTIMVRSGACYRCDECGGSSGCG